jgi:predicted transcriptional regulator
LVKSEIVKVTEEMQTVSRQLFEARRKFADDPEIKAARDAIQKAQKAYEDLMNTKLKGNPELEPLMKKMEELKAQRKQIEEQMRAPAPVPSPRAPVKP